MEPNVHDIIKNHVTLSVTCVDRLYVNGYVPTLQTSGQLCYFLKDHRGNPIPSPALFGPMRNRFLAEIERFAQTNRIPQVEFKRGERKDEVANRLRTRFKAAEGVVFIGVAQEKASSFKARKVRGPKGGVGFDFSRQPVAVNHYYFYLQDRRWGPGFVKIGSYLPFPVKLCLNGHEWVKQRLREQRIGFESLDNGFLSCTNPERLQQLCDSLGPAEVQDFLDRWSHKLPWPLLRKDRAAGFDHKLSLWQLEVSLTHVFDEPVQGRLFFDGIVGDNLDLGRPDRVSLLFPNRHTRRTVPPKHGYRTRVITRGVDPSLHISYRRSDLKQYFKLGKAGRTELTINDPADFGCTKSLRNLGYLRNVGATVNRRLLEQERIGHNCALSQQAFDRLQRPTEEQGYRASALRFGDPRVMALLQVLAQFGQVAADFRNADIRAKVAALLGLALTDYTCGMMTYDLRRLNRKGLISRVNGTHRYRVTSYGLKSALFMSKVFLRILRPGSQSLQDNPDDIQRPLRKALAAVDAEIAHMCDAAQLQPAA